MKKYIIILSCITNLFCNAQSLKVPAKVCDDKTNDYVCETNVEIKTNVENSALIITVTPFPKTQYGIGYFFGQASQYSSTWQNLCDGADNYWILSTLLQNNETARHYLGFYSGKNGCLLYFYKKAYEDDTPDYYRGYHLSFEYGDLNKIMSFVVSHMNLFKKLPSKAL